MLMSASRQERLRIVNSGLRRDRAYWGGAWREAASGGAIEVVDPFSGERVGSVPSLGAGEVEAALQAAGHAFETWSRETGPTRGALLRRWRDLIEENKQDLARLITLENGKPLREARAEVDYGAGFVDLYAEEATRIYGESIPSPTPGRRLSVEREPVGVCVAITPWNFPLAMLTRKFAPAIAAGCTVVAKPASLTPLSALALAALGEAAGLPPGVFNVVTGRASMIGDIVTRSALVRKISFTGSTEIGAQLMAASAPTIKRLSLELGGNAPLLVFDDADLDVAIETAMVAKFRNSGQSCIAANRIYCQRGIHDAFVTRFAERVAELAVGDGADPGTDIGPLIDEAAVAKVDQHLDDAVAGGANILVGGRSGGGRIAAPTLLQGVRTDALVTREETFGPLAAVIAFGAVEEGLKLANDTPFGLAAYVCSSSPATIARASRGIESGMVGINTGLISTAVAPFGGVKLSGLGREGSRHGLDEYLSLKYLCQAGL
jgi:succinate-semialdehyde dehydrogenase/glutarate-semialdehyde dehydrogenase